MLYSPRAQADDECEMDQAELLQRQQTRKALAAEVPYTLHNLGGKSAAPP